MAEDKAGKATAYPRSICCEGCGVEMWATSKNARIEGTGRYYPHPTDISCPNAGKRFKVATVELEEL
jgi:hypothetical protein